MLVRAAPYQTVDGQHHFKWRTVTPLGDDVFFERSAAEFVDTSRAAHLEWLEQRFIRFGKGEHDA